MRRIVPEDLVRWKLEKYLGVDSHLERLNSDLLPVWEFGRKGNVPRLEDTHGKRGDRVLRLDAARVRVGNGDAMVRPGDVGDDCGQEQARIVLGEELGSLAMDKGVIPTLVNHEIVDLRKPVKCGILNQSVRAVPF